MFYFWRGIQSLTTVDKVVVCLVKNLSQHEFGVYDTKNQKNFRLSTPKSKNFT